MTMRIPGPYKKLGTGSGKTLGLNAKDFGATGNGTTDDTTALQNAINTALIAGSRLYIPEGSYKLSAALNITSRITIFGAGFQGDSGANNIGGSGSYNSAGNVTAATGWKGTALICSSGHTCFNIVTNNAITITDLQITYPTQPSAGTTAITGAAASGSTSNNTNSLFRDLFISGGDVGIQLINFINFTIDRCTIACWTGSVYISVPNYGSFGDSNICNCTMYGRNIAQHIFCSSMGGLRIENNKLVSGTVGIYFLADLTGNQFEPVVITGNSIEGQTVGIQFNRNTGSTTQASQVVITGNQLYVGTYGINVIRNPASNWFTAFTICGNTFTLNNASGVGVQLDGSTLGVITGNMFANSVTGGTGVILGTNTSGINVQSNAYYTGLTTTVNNAGGAGNHLGSAGATN